MQHTALHTTTVQPSSHNQWYVLIGKQWYQLPNLFQPIQILINKRYVLFVKQLVVPDVRGFSHAMHSYTKTLVLMKAELR